MNPRILLLTSNFGGRLAHNQGLFVVCYFVGGACTDAILFSAFSSPATYERLRNFIDVYTYIFETKARLFVCAFGFLALILVFILNNTLKIKHNYHEYK